MRKKLDRSKPILLNEVYNLDVTQADVDFVIPNLVDDTRLGIDPFLLFKSRNPEYKTIHDNLIAVFNDAMQKYKQGKRDEATYLLDFPEVEEINLGYKIGHNHGSGMGKYLNNLLLQTLGESPALVARGVRHVEEMQLFTLGINADRVSDMTANIIKEFLISYTQRQSEIYGIPLTKGVPISHVFDYASWDWRDDYYDLPVNPIDPHKRGIILVPRRIVRKLPWINFNDYQSMEFGMFLRAQRLRKAVSKDEIIAVSRSEVERVDHYIETKEKDSKYADPELLISATPALKQECDVLITELRSLKPGHADAYRFQDLMFRILNVLFTPDLTEGKKQERSEHGTEIRDIIFFNESDKPFWDYIRNVYRNILIVFECKNTENVSIGDIDQLAGYRGDSLGYFGIILTRVSFSDERRLKCISWYNKSSPRRVIIELNDFDIERMLLIRGLGNNPSEVIQNKYREFIVKAQ